MWTIGLAVGSLGATSFHPWSALWSNLGASMSCWVAHRALTSLPVSSRLVGPVSLSLWSLVLVWAAWGVAGLAAFGEASGMLFPLALSSYALALAAGTLSLTVLGAWLLKLRFRLRWDLEGKARVHGALFGYAGLVVLGGTLGAFQFGALERLVKLGVALSAWGIAYSAEKARAAEVLRTGLRVGVRLGVCSAMVAAGAFGAGRLQATPVHFIVYGLLGLAFAFLTEALTTQLQASSNRVEATVQKALEALTRSTPQEAVHAALFAMRERLGLSVSPELWLLNPLRVLTVDAAGYLHTRPGELPDRLVELASGEPEATLWQPFAEARGVRHPEVRPVAKWLTEKNIRLVTLVTRHGEAEGMLAIPQLPDAQAITLDEVRGFKRLADGLAAVCYGQTALARSLEVEKSATDRITAAEERATYLQRECIRWQKELARSVKHLAEPVCAENSKSPAIRFALSAIETRVHQGLPLALGVPSGVDAIPFLAYIHQKGPHSSGPLILIEGTSSQSETDWKNPEKSPLAFAQGGVLVLLDVGALPSKLQRLVACALVDKKASWPSGTLLDVGIVVTSLLSFNALIEHGQLDKSLVAALGNACTESIRLPTLLERAEDLQPLLQKRLYQEGLRMKGRMLRFEPAALEQLINYPFPGGEAELILLIQRLVALTKGDSVQLSEVEAVLQALRLLYGLKQSPMERTEEPSP